jgi:predicted nuclease with TOPRIM domain
VAAVDDQSGSPEVVEYTRRCYDVAFEEKFDDVAAELQRLSTRLFELLPDRALSPLERVERLARVVPDSVLQSEHMKTARTKLSNIRRRLEELVPDHAMTTDEKIEHLVERVHQLVPEREPRLFKKLEKLGDIRPTDIGY